jgi:hypothetical protein
MNNLVHYYFHQAFRVAGHSVGTIYAHPRFFSTRLRNWEFLGWLLRFLLPMFRKVAKAIVLEALVTGRNFVNDMARNTDSNAKIRDIICRNMFVSAYRVIKI